jgi:hypothetical protein
MGLQNQRRRSCQQEVAILSPSVLPATAAGDRVPFVLNLLREGHRAGNPGAIDRKTKK